MYVWVRAYMRVCDVCVCWGGNPGLSASDFNVSHLFYFALGEEIGSFYVTQARLKLEATLLPQLLRNRNCKPVPKWSGMSVLCFAILFYSILTSQFTLGGSSVSPFYMKFNLEIGYLELLG